MWKGVWKVSERTVSSVWTWMVQCLPMFCRQSHWTLCTIKMFSFIYNTKDTNTKNLKNPYNSIWGSLSAVFMHWMDFEIYLLYNVHNRFMIIILSSVSPTFMQGTYWPRKLEWSCTKLRCWNIGLEKLASNMCFMSSVHFCKTQYKSSNIRGRMKY